MSHKTYRTLQNPASIPLRASMVVRQGSGRGERRRELSGQTLPSLFACGGEHASRTSAERRLSDASIARAKRLQPSYSFKLLAHVWRHPSDKSLYFYQRNLRQQNKNTAVVKRASIADGIYPHASRGPQVPDPQASSWPFLPLRRDLAPTSSQ